MSRSVRKNVGSCLHLTLVDRPETVATEEMACSCAATDGDAAASMAEQYAARQRLHKEKKKVRPSSSRQHSRACCGTASPPPTLPRLLCLPIGPRSFSTALCQASLLRRVHVALYSPKLQQSGS